MNFENFLQMDGNDLIASLDGYQQELVKVLIDQAGGDYCVAADNWLSATPSNTFKFGGEHKKSSIFRDKVFEEVEKFICGCDDGRYDKEREELNSQTDLTKEAIISALSAAIGNYIGVAGAFIAPVVVLIFLSTGKIVKNAWCEMMKEKKKTTNVGISIQD